MFSQWLLKELELLDAPIRLYWALPDGSSTQVRVPIKLDTFKLNRVCESCNNGWMHRLETVTKPILLRLIRGTGTLTALDEEERRIPAKWAGKTAIIESYAVGANLR